MKELMHVVGNHSLTPAKPPTEPLGVVQMTYRCGCPHCGMWKFPQELGGTVVVVEAKGSRGKVRRERKRLCKACEAKTP